jgi:hypothetical protein
MERFDLVGLDVVEQRLGHEYGGGPMTIRHGTTHPMTTVRGSRRGVIWD